MEEGPAGAVRERPGHHRVRTLFELVAAAARAHGDRTFLSGPAVLSHAAADRAITGMAGGLARRGVRSGDRVVLIGHPRPETVLVALAVARLGGVFVILHPETGRRSLSRILEQTEPALFLRAVDRLLTATGPDPADPDPADPAAIIYTSGSSGEPRGVTVSHRNVLFTTQAIQRRLRYRPDDVIGLCLPLSFDYGLYQIFLALHSGAEVRLGGPAHPGPAWVGDLARHRVSVLPLVPCQIAALCRLLERRRTALPALRMITSTGEHLPATLVARLHDLLPHVVVHSMYGLTECKRATILPPEEWAVSPGSVGRPLDGTDIYAVGPGGERLGPGHSGELVVRGPNVALGYWGDPTATAACFQTGADGGRLLRTGDIGQVDTRGYVRLEGRLDRLVKRRGHRISPAEVEQAALALPGVLEAAVIADSDSLILYCRTAGDPTKADLLSGLRGSLEPYKLPDRIRLVDPLPRTRHLKVDQLLLREDHVGR